MNAGMFVARRCDCGRRIGMCFAAAAILAGMVLWGASPTMAQRARKAPPPPPPPPRTQAAAPAASSAVPIVSVPREAEILFPPSPATRALIGSEVFDLAKGTRVGSAASLPANASVPRALSPSGRYFAFQNDADHVMFVEIQDCAAGKKVHEFRYNEDKFQRVVLLRFTRHDKLLVAAPVKEQAKTMLGIFVIDPASGKTLKKFSVENVDSRKLGFSDDGRFVAVATGAGLEVYDVTKGKPVARMAEPAKKNNVSPWMFANGFYFAPDNSELAGLIATGTFRLVVWGNDGQVKEDHELGLRIGGGYNQGEPVQWSPDGQGWLLHGNHYFDRKLASIGWSMTSPPAHNYHHVWLDSQRIAASQGDFQNRQLVAVAVPRETIAAAVKAMESGEKAHLRPGSRLSIEVEVGETRFSDRNTVAAALQEVLTKRFAEGGISVESGQSSVLRVKYSENAGEELRVMEGGLGPRARDTGQRVQETVAVFEAKLTVPGAKEPIWETTIRRGNPRIVRSETVGDADVRNATFKMLDYILSSTPMPFFIPADPKAPSLPLLTAL